MLELAKRQHKIIKPKGNKATLITFSFYVERRVI